MSAHPQRPRSAAEWVMLALSAFIVGALIVIALVEESHRQTEPGAGLSVTFDRGESSMVAGNFYVPFTVTNTGSSAISSADIWIEVFDDEVLAESAEITVEFLPLQGQQHGIYVSKLDPSSHQLRGRLESLQFP